MHAFLEEFKAFAVRGNVIDLAVAVVIGGAFGNIVSSLVNHIIMPLVGILTSGVDFSTLSLVLRKGSAGTPDVVLSYGLFLNAVLTFLIVAFTIFVVIRQMNRFVKHTREEAERIEKPSKEEALLTEIRDLLKK